MLAGSWLVVTKTGFVLVTESLMVEVAPSKERSFL